ncbi:hypothetical protein [Burkholderia gladioli]|uniref:hypothetical protein n=1 Tax=Burkholderia gladioli TaxID=28095 RepID=UPI001640A6E1|nr:hypothetical protein [Burkholderia gladioli]
MRDQSPVRKEQFEFVEHKSLEVGWFPHVGISLSFWHGGQRLKDGSSWAYRNESVRDSAADAAERDCQRYGITRESSLELVQIRRDTEEPKVYREGNWVDIDRNRDRFVVPDERMLRCHLIWSSKTGYAPPLEMWERHRIGFAKYIPVTGKAAEEHDLARYFTTEVSLYHEDILYRGVAISDAQIQNLQIINISAESTKKTGQLAKMTGDFEVAVLPGSGLTHKTILELVAEDVSLAARPKGTDVRWDNQAEKEPDAEWWIDRV